MHIKIYAGICAYIEADLGTEDEIPSLGYQNQVSPTMLKLLEATLRVPISILRTNIKPF